MTNENNEPNMTANEGSPKGMTSNNGNNSKLTDEATDKLHLNDSTDSSDTKDPNNLEGREDKESLAEEPNLTNNVEENMSSVEPSPQEVEVQAEKVSLKPKIIPDKVIPKTEAELREKRFFEKTKELINKTAIGAARSNNLSYRARIIYSMGGNPERLKLFNEAYSAERKKIELERNNSLQNRLKIGAINKITEFGDSIVEVATRKITASVKGRISPQVSSSVVGVVAAARKKRQQADRLLKENFIKAGIAVVSNAVNNTISRITAAIGLDKAIDSVTKSLVGLTGPIGSLATLAGNGLQSLPSAAIAALPVALLTASPGAALGVGAAVMGTQAVTKTIKQVLDMNTKDFTRSAFYKTAGLLDRFGIVDQQAFKTWHSVNTTQIFSKNNIVVSALKGDADALKEFPKPRVFTRFGSVVGGVDRALNLAGIGATAGGLLFGPAGVALGAAVFAGIGFSSQFIEDAVKERVAKLLINSSLFESLKALPLSNIEGVIRGNQWLQMQAKLLLDSNGYFKTSKNFNVKNLAPSIIDKEIYGWSNPLNVGLNLIQLGGYVYNLNAAFTKLLADEGLQGLTTLISDGGVARFGFLKGALNVVKGLSVLTPNVLRGVQIGGIAGSFIGTALGAVVATYLGINVGIAAAAVGAIGGLIGGIVGGLAGAGASTVTVVGIPVGAVAGATLGSAIGSFIGTVAGGVLDSIGSLFSAGPSISPLVLIQGVYDFFRLMTTPIRRLGDYAAVGLIGLSLINFFVALDKITGFSAVNTQNNLSSANSTIISNLELTASAVNISKDNATVVLNKTKSGTYSFKNLADFTDISASQIAFSVDNKYWILDKPGKYIYDPSSHTLVGQGQDIEANIYIKSSQQDASANGTKLEFQKTTFCGVLTNCQ